MDIALGDIQIDGKNYRIDFDSWNGKDVIDFAPRATVPGGSAVMSDLGLFQPLLQTDWRHGFGFHWYSDAMGYLQTVGNIDTRQDGLVMLFTKPTQSDTNNNRKNGMVTFNNKIYAWGAGGLRRFDGSSWADIYTAGAVNHALSAGSYLFFCPDGARIKKMDTAEVVTDAGLDANATDYKWLVIHNGYVFAGKDNSNAIHFDNSETLSTLQGNTSDPNRILVGLGANPTLGAIVYNGNLYVRKSDGIWIIGEDRIARRMLDFSAEESSNNLRSWAVINGYLVMPLRDRILQWNGARVSDITPRKLNDEFPYITYGRFNNFVPVGDFLYITARTNESSYDEDLLAWDGVGWHKLATLLENVSAGEISMMGYEAVNNRLWFHRDETLDTTHYIPFQNLSTFPYADFPVSGQHSLITSRIDVGFRRVQKSMDKLVMEVQNCNTTSYIKVYYSLDGGSWVFWKDIKTSGVVELTNPGGSASREFNWVQLRFDFVTSSATQSPILEGFSLSFIMRPKTRMGYNFTVLAVTNFEQGMYQDNRTSAEIRSELKAVRDSAAPVEMVDIYGNTHKGYITAITERPIYRRPDEGGDEIDVEVMFQVNWVDV